ncbi:MAG: MarR family transcriptional regulator [Candidatus Obscuribacterales bacterium]|nr:MarR family transcriptional regulator [Candidatus Obscuribacterales bacterium]
MADFEGDKKSAGSAGTRIWLSLWKSGRSIESHAMASIASLGMTLTDFAVLEVLLHKGPLPVNTIGKKVLLTSGSITTAVDRLEEKGLVERLDSPSDRRVRIVSLTKEGARQIKVAFAEHQKHLETAVSPLTKDEQRQLVELLKKLGRGADLLKVSKIGQAKPRPV